MMWLLETAGKMSLVLGIGLLAAIALRQASAAFRHWVIAAALFCAAAVPVLGLVAPAWTLPPAPIGAGGPVAEISITSDGALNDDTLSREGQSIRMTVPVLNRLSDLVLPMWVVGVGLNLVVMFAGMFRLAKLASRAAVVRSGVWTESLIHVSQVLGVRRPIALLRSDRPDLLVTWGQAFPKVVLPADAADWPDERIHVVLAHEVAHVARGDWLVLIAAELLRCIYWFNPLFWIACTRLRYESEHACDDAVMNAGVEGDVYATHLLELARTFGRHRRTWFPAPAMAGHAEPSSQSSSDHATRPRGVDARAPGDHPANRCVCAGVVRICLWDRC